MHHKLLGKSQRPALDNVNNYYLSNARLEKGYSQKELARKVGVSFSAISNYERLRALPDPYIAKKLARVLGKKIDELFPRELRDYVREARVERYGGNDALEHAVGLTPSVERRLEDSSEKPEDKLTREHLLRRMNGILNTLSDREREIVTLRYGLEDGKNYTLEEVGHVLRVTFERVRQIEAKAIRKLQQPGRSQQVVKFLDELDC